VRLLDRLDAIPGRHHLIRRLGDDIAEHVGMPRDHLGRHVGGDILEGEAAGLGLDVRVEDHLIQHVAELLDELLAGAALDRLDQLVALLDEVLHKRLVRLVAVPRASARRTQPVQRRDQLVEPWIR
jgi:hypothetical protein